MTSTKPEADKPSAKAIGKKSGLLICSLNAPSLLKHKDEIEVLLNENRINILAIITINDLILNSTPNWTNLSLIHISPLKIIANP